MSTTVEGMTFALGVAYAEAACSESGKLLALARVGLDAALALGRRGIGGESELDLQRARQAFQAAADSVRADLREQRRAA